MGSMERRGGGRELEMCPRVAAQAGRRHCADGAAADRAVQTAIAAAWILRHCRAPRPARWRGTLGFLRTREGLLKLIMSAIRRR